MIPGTSARTTIPSLPVAGTAGDPERFTHNVCGFATHRPLKPP